MAALRHLHEGTALARRVEQGLLPLFKAMAVLAAMAGATIVVLIGTSVAMRYFASSPFRFTEELVGLLMTAAFFLALPLATLRGEHVRITLLVNMLPVAIRNLLAVLAGLAGAAFCFWFLALGVPWLEFAFDRNIRSEASRLLLYPWMALLPFSMLMTLIAFLLRSVTGAGEPKSE